MTLVTTSNGMEIIDNLSNGSYFQGDILHPKKLNENL
jgi:hypothetical protein